MKHWSIYLFIASVIALFLYSYTQVDLSLTLSQASLYQTIEKGFQYIGWFNRPLSAYLFIAILFLLFISYGVLFKQVLKGEIKRSVVWKMIFFSLILVLSYNAFSYDLFNYIFDAKIVTHYGQNPYLHKALDFPHEPMLSFMRWTHRVYPYGPFWLVLTVPISYLGLGYFLPTFFLFKIMIGLSFLVSCYFLEKALNHFSKEDSLLGLTFFALNPLILIESLVSAHIDTVMMAFCILSLYFLLKNNVSKAVILYVLSILIKFATGFLLPLFTWFLLYKKIDQKLFFVATVLMSIAVVASSYWSGNFQPWYLLGVFPFAAFIIRDKRIFISSFIFSICSLLQYLPYIYLGNWDKPVPLILMSLNVVAIVLSCITIIWYSNKKKTQFS